VQAKYTLPGKKSIDDDRNKFSRLLLDAYSRFVARNRLMNFAWGEASREEFSRQFALIAEKN
jgi:DNA-binding winged helix-turn-helix (wHTH) protein